MSFFFFFFNDTATTEIYTLSLHDALPISFAQNAQASASGGHWSCTQHSSTGSQRGPESSHRDRKSTRLNSSHGYISYAVFCLKKKKKSYSITLYKILPVSYRKHRDKHVAL